MFYCSCVVCVEIKKYEPSNPVRCFQDWIKPIFNFIWIWRSVFPFLKRKDTGILIRDYFDSINLWVIFYLNHIFKLYFNFFQQCFVIFKAYKSFILVKLIPCYFILLDAFIKCNCFQFSLFSTCIESNQYSYVCLLKNLLNFCSMLLWIYWDFLYVGSSSDNRNNFTSALHFEDIFVYLFCLIALIRTSNPV